VGLAVPFCISGLLSRLGTIGDDADALVHVVNGAVDVAESALLQALGELVVFFLGDVAMGFLEKFLGAMQAAGIVEAGIDRRMVVQVFAIIDGRFLDFRDGVVNGVDGFLFFVT
jgi:hypothetical protein